MDNNARKVPIYKLLYHSKVLAHLDSFCANIDRCNFTIYKGWGGKTYVEDLGHGVDEYKPTLRGVEALELYHIKLTDYVILTEEQYKEYLLVLDEGRRSASFNKS